MSKSYNVIVWGPGTAGRILIRYAAQLANLNLVGVLAYDPEKEGKDVGQLAGLSDLEIYATTDKEAICRMKADCVLYVPRDTSPDHSEDDANIIALLSSGKNVITAMAYHYPYARSDKGKTLETAALKGDATLFATGIQPGIFVERLALSMAGACMDIKCIYLEEYFNGEHLGSAETLLGFGFGTDFCNITPEGTVADMIRKYYEPLIHYVGDHLGFPFEKLEIECSAIPVSKDFVIPAMEVKKGTTGSITYRWKGYSNGSPFIEITTNWYLSEAMRPEHVACDDHWKIAIDGTPGIKAAFDLVPSLTDPELELFAGDGIKTSPAYYATVIPIIQAIPIVIAAKPGIMTTPAPFAHWHSSLLCD